MTHFIFLDSEITVDSDYSHEIKRHLLFGRKTMTNLDNVLKKKQRQHFLKKVHKIKAMVFSIVIYRCKSQTIKKAEHWRTDDFKLFYCRRLYFFLFILIGRQSLHNTMVAPDTLAWISHGHACAPPSWTPLLLPTFPIPSGLSVPEHHLWESCLMLWEFLGQQGEQTLTANLSVNPKGNQPWIFTGRNDS